MTCHYIILIPPELQNQVFQFQATGVGVSRQARSSSKPNTMILNKSLNLCESQCFHLKIEGAQLDHCGSSWRFNIHSLRISNTYTVILTFSQTTVQVRACLQTPCLRTLPISSYVLQVKTCNSTQAFTQRRHSLAMGCIKCLPWVPPTVTY